MTMSWKRKRKVRKIRVERMRCNPGNKCMMCGIKLSKDIHHFYCNRCWKIKESRKRGDALKWEKCGEITQR